MTTALMRSDASLTLGDVLLLELPQFDERTRIDILWEFTGWPEFWPLVHRCAHCGHVRTADHWIQQLRQQLRDFRDGTAVHPTT